MDNDAIAALRRDYALAALDEATLPGEPIAMFEHWLEEAVAARVPEPNAMTLATIGESGRPRSRIVLLKGIDTGFRFFTNYDSAKGRELAATPFAALQFHWVELERQVRIEGRVERLEVGASEDYFASRPMLSRLGAWASPQSQVVRDRADLERRFEEARARFGDDVPRPLHWGGYRVVPERVEFWQGRRSRLHDRVRFESRSTGWIVERLAP